MALRTRASRHSSAPPARSGRAPSRPRRAAAARRAGPRRRPRARTARPGSLRGAPRRARARSRRARSGAARPRGGGRPGASRRRARGARAAAARASSVSITSSRCLRPSRIDVSAWPVSSWSSRASRARSSSCASTTRRSASRLTRSERSTAIAARATSDSARRTSPSSKRGSAAELVVDRDDADRLAAHDERQVDRGRDPELTGDALVDLRVVDDGVDALGRARGRARGRPSSSRSRGSVPTRSASPAAAATASEPSSVGQGDQHDPRLDEVPHPSRDEREQRFQLHFRGERVPDLVERLELTEPARRRLVQACVLDRDRGLRGEQLRELLVLRGEVGAAGLLGQVEVPVGDAPQHDRDAEKRLHRRVVAREADRARVLGDLVQPQRLRVPDQHAEDAAPARQRRRSPSGSRGRSPSVRKRSSPWPARSMTPSAA